MEKSGGDDNSVVAAEMENGLQNAGKLSSDDDVTPTTPLQLIQDGFISTPAVAANNNSNNNDGVKNKKIDKKNILPVIDTRKITIVDDDGDGDRRGEEDDDENFNPTLTPTSGDEADVQRHELAAKKLKNGPGGGSSNGGGGGASSSSYRVYPRRWLMLWVVSLLNCSNTWSWIGYAPVSNYVDCYYGSSSTATWLSTVFLIAAVPVAVAAMWAVRRFGLRFSILVAAWTNGLGACVRLLSSALVPSASGRYVVLLGQLLAAIAYPFIMFLPTKVAAAWFADSQRPLATMVAAMSNPLGVLLANLISPQLVAESGDVLYLNILLSILPTATIFLATFGVRTSSPPSPPGFAASQESLPFWPGVKRCLTSRTFLILLAALGGGMGMFNALYSMMQQILCSRGYSNSFAGVCCILMIVGGICGAMGSAKIVSLTKRFEETMKVSFGMAVLGGIVFSVVALKPDLRALIAVTCAVFGFFGLAAYPTGLEMGAECTYPAAETTSTGLIVLSGQIQGVLYIMLMEFVGRPLTNPADLEREVCSVGRARAALHEALEEGGNGNGALKVGTCGPASVQPKDMTWAMVVFAAVAALLACLFIVLFKPRLKRSMLEATGKAASSKKKIGASAGRSQNPNPATTTTTNTMPGSRVVEMKIISGDDAKAKQPLTVDA